MLTLRLLTIHSPAPVERLPINSKPIYVGREKRLALERSVRTEEKCKLFEKVSLVQKEYEGLLSHREWRPALARSQQKHKVLEATCENLEQSKSKLEDEILLPEKLQERLRPLPFLTRDYICTPKPHPKVGTSNLLVEKGATTVLFLRQGLTVQPDLKLREICLPMTRVLPSPPVNKSLSACVIYGNYPVY